MGERIGLDALDLGAGLGANQRGGKRDTDGWIANYDRVDVGRLGMVHGG